MTPKERAAMQQAMEALLRYRNELPINNQTRAIAYKADEAIFAMREALYHSGEANEMVGCAYCNNPLFAGTKCNNCGFITLAEQAEPNSTFMEGYRIGLAEMREKCATVSEQGTGEAVQKTALELLLNERKRIAAAIRAIKFEGDTGFRPVSEMIAEHKQDTKKAAAIEKAKMRKATRDEKTVRPGVYEVPVEQAEQEPVAKIALKNCIYFDSIDFNQNPPYLRYDTGDSTSKENWIIYCDIQEELRKNGYELTDSDVDHDTVCGDVTPMAAPVRTKDLTDDEIANTLEKTLVVEDERFEFQGGRILTIRESELLPIARAVIAADREKNK